MIDEKIFEILRLAKDLGNARFSDFMSLVNNPRTLSRKIKILLDHNLLVKGRFGYRITDKGLRVLELMSSLISELSYENIINIDRIPHRYYASLLERYCVELIKYFGERLISVVLFGSIARGDWVKDSDIDLLVVIDNWHNVPIWKRIRELFNVRERLKDSREYRDAYKAGFIPIIQHYPLDKREAFNFHRIYLDIVMDGIILYDRDNFMFNIISSFRKRLAEFNAKRVCMPNGRFYWIIRDIRAGEEFNL